MSERVSVSCSETFPPETTASEALRWALAVVERWEREGFEDFWVNLGQPVFAQTGARVWLSADKKTGGAS